LPLTLNEGLLTGEFDLGGGTHTDFAVISIEASKHTDALFKTTSIWNGCLNFDVSARFFSRFIITNKSHATRLDDGVDATAADAVICAVGGSDGENTSMETCDGGGDAGDGRIRRGRPRGGR